MRSTLPSWLQAVQHGQETSLWDTAVERLIPYLAQMGFTHVELLPIAEYPFGGSWGYQPLGLFAPGSRLGTPEGFARFVDELHRAEIGIILDWVPAAFSHRPARLGPIRQDCALRASRSARRISPGLEHLHLQFRPPRVLRVSDRERAVLAGIFTWTALRYSDAVASMLYRDYSRKAGKWVPNIYGSRENLEAIGFLRHLNAVVAERCPGAIMIAEESTAWPGVSRPISAGGLGFSYKWNMGWMHDTLNYIAKQPVHRQFLPNAT